MAKPKFQIKTEAAYKMRKINVKAPCQVTGDFALGEKNELSCNTFLWNQAFSR